MYELSIFISLYISSTMGIAFLTAVRAVVVAKPVMLGILSSTSLILKL